MDVLSTFLVLTIAGAVFAIVVRLALPRLLARRGVWFRWHTRFGPALVFDSEDEDGTTVRLLNVNGTYQSVCYVDDDLLWVPVCEYHRTWAKAVRRRFGAPAETPSKADCIARRALVMGGGGYSFPKWLVAYRPDFSCEAVEIDPAIEEIAREQFFVDRLVDEFDTEHSRRLVLTVADAWDRLLADEEGFDLIINDAFGGNRPLGRLSTDEGARHIRAHLHEGGLYIGNVRTPLEGRRAEPLRDAVRAFEAEFEHVQVIPERPEDPRKKGNNALIAW